MRPHTQRLFASTPPRHTCPSTPPSPPLRRLFPFKTISLAQRCHLSVPDSPCSSQTQTTTRRRQVLLTPLLALGVSILQSAASKAEVANKEPDSPPPPPPPPVAAEKKAEEVISSRIYDATVIGEPMAVGKDKRKVWEKIMNGRIVYLGEAEQVPIKDDKELELEIVKNLKKQCDEREKSISLAMEAFPCDLQRLLNEYLDKRIDGETLKGYMTHWPPQGWQECEPLLSYCRDNGIRIVACGVPLKVLRTVQAEGIRGLSKADRKLYAPPAGSGFISGFSSISRRSTDMNAPKQSVPFGPSSYLSAQARVVEDHAMSQIIMQAVIDGGANGLLVVVTGASHVMYGSRGTGLPARISKKTQKKNQVVILLDPERQFIRREGEVPVGDFLWYSAARPCNRNCFDRAEIARVMNAAGRRRDALPQDLQKGLDLGLVSPEVLQNFFDLEQYPIIKELTHRFQLLDIIICLIWDAARKGNVVGTYLTIARLSVQGFRERLLADPKFLHRLAIEEAISITTTLLAQYERRKENFFEELDYVITDTVRGIVVDFFTVWLPAPTLSFLSYADDTAVPDSVDALKGLLKSIPDNAFQKNLVGKDWNISHRVASVIVGGLKLSSVGFISSIGAVAASNLLYAIRKLITPALVTDQRTKRSPILKTAAIYGCFLGTSANLRYQIIAGIVEHRISDEFSSQTLLVNMLSFIVRTINSYWGTQQWVDLARFSGLQSQKSEPPSYLTLDSPSNAAIGCNTLEDTNIDEINNQ
ncbi:hypothetical protein POTOM_031266 [Populus tomentosa]|uniref:Haem-binding uptake Tiki superfamily ChaN domain-containing protein n=1 Tax=Populus tomentosa TaxID=118781 RepID=A0A8X7Z2A6_POPTO|nr:hypothetical protein POTOM_031266 [Populus tomentosa]